MGFQPAIRIIGVNDVWSTDRSISVFHQPFIKFAVEMKFFSFRTVISMHVSFYHAEINQINSSALLATICDMAILTPSAHRK